MIIIIFPSQEPLYRRSPTFIGMTSLVYTLPRRHSRRVSYCQSSSLISLLVSREQELSCNYNYTCNIDSNPPPSTLIGVNIVDQATPTCMLVCGDVTTPTSCACDSGIIICYVNILCFLCAGKRKPWRGILLYGVSHSALRVSYLV